MWERERGHQPRKQQNTGRNDSITPDGRPDDLSDDLDRPSPTAGAGTHERWQERENISTDQVTDLWLITGRSLSEEAGARAERHKSDQPGFK